MPGEIGQEAAFGALLGALRLKWIIKYRKYNILKSLFESGQGHQICMRFAACQPARGFGIAPLSRINHLSPMSLHVLAGSG